MAAAAHFLIRKKLFNTEYPQLLVAKDFAVAEKKLHLTVSRRKYDPGKKAPKRKRTSDESVSEQQQGTSAAEQQPQDKASDTLASQSSNDDTPLPDYAAALKTFTMKDPSSVPKKPRYSL